MRTLETGCSERGFTLVEVLAVLSIIILLTPLILPRLFDTGRERFLKEGRHIAALSSHLSSLSALKKTGIRLYYDLSDGLYWAERVDGRPLDGALTGRRRLPEGVSFLEVKVGGEALRGGGVISTLFTPWGYRDRTLIYLRYRDETLTISIPPFGGNVKIHRGYVRDESL